ncbi:MAG: excinuclease ABC subunit C [Candidatus Woesearchaeota archaeon]|jgi:excinuclease ABC subunit C
MIPMTAIPTKPGCYIHKNKAGKIIYIGKAKNLRKRVSNYFQKNHEDEKTRLLVSHIEDTEYIITNTEVEALLLESKLIKQHKPKYNIDLKDTERYAWIKITDEEVPRIITARRKTRDGEYFGPFVDGYARVMVIKTLNEAFQLRTCKVLPKTVCLQYHIGLCSGPCQEKISLADYTKRIQHARKYLKGDVKEVLDQLQTEMKLFAKKNNFELAKTRRDQIQSIEKLQQRQVIDTQKEYDQDVIGFSTDNERVIYFIFTIIKGVLNKKESFEFEIQTSLHQTHIEFLMQYYDTRIAPKEILITKDFLPADDIKTVSLALSSLRSYTVSFTQPKIGEKKSLLDLACTNADYGLSGENPTLIKLKELLHLPSIPTNIECYDISNLGDSYIVGAKIHFTNGEPNKELYRKYRIRWRSTQNDFASMYEVLKRRFARVRDGEEPAPDLVVIDGGRGQLTAALQAVKEVGVRVPIISLAKKEEEIYFPGIKKPINTKSNKSRDPAITLLQRIRDETHRFVISYHRHLRDTIREE